MKRFLCFAVIFLFTVPALTAECSDHTKWDNLLVESAKVFDEMTKMPEDSIPEGLIKDCYAIAIFPSTISGGFVIGGTYGQGVIVERDRDKRKWGAPAVFNLAGGSFGWQIGGQAVDVILLIMNERGLDGLLQSKFKLGGDAAIAAGPVGRNAEASTDLQLKGGILSYSRSRGLFIGLKLEGSVIYFNKEGNYSLYTAGITAKEILEGKKITLPESSERLIKELSRY